ncbi:MAG: metalloregulator ArsR/SmtB family transcription factor [Phyllobacteriaceae bacterium]|jgi:ArsR family transcriptional regulator|nr:metalloregulator ArsR/SmtB family transcription factor [Phyllobacteriaceae bacterium]
MSFSNDNDTRFAVDAMVEHLKSAAEPSRLRMLKLLSEADLTVSDLTTILGQSQPRVSRHLKLLLEARLIRRRQEGSWALFRLAHDSPQGALAADILTRIDPADPVLTRDAERLADVKRRRRDEASAYFSANAESWDSIRSLHVPERKVEQALVRLAGDRTFNAMLDIGTGTGRMLEVFAPRFRSAVGIDTNRKMLNVARANLDATGLVNAEVRMGDVFNMPVERDAFDLVTIHQVLHFLDDPAAAVAQAARSLAPGGRLMIIDFAPHDLEFLREEHQHHRLGFDTATVTAWFEAAGLENIRAEALPSSKGDGDGQLTVMIWSADDPRYVIADETGPDRDTTEAA